MLPDVSSTSTVRFSCCRTMRNVGAVELTSRGGLFPSAKSSCSRITCGARAKIPLYARFAKADTCSGRASTKCRLQRTVRPNDLSARIPLLLCLWEDGIKFICANLPNTFSEALTVLSVRRVSIVAQRGLHFIVAEFHDLKQGSAGYENSKILVTVSKNKIHLS